MNKHETQILNYPIFDGNNIIKNASVVIEDGKIVSINEAKNSDENHLLIPGLIDAHTHMTTEDQIKKMLENGIVATCDVCAPSFLIDNSKYFKIISSLGMTFGTLNGKSYVKKAIKNGAKYIKVLLMEPNLIFKNVLKDICLTAHENNIKVAAHATTVKSIKLAVDCGVDILIHVPLKEEFPNELVQEIASKGIVVAPTLVMMQTFANSNKNGYKPEHFNNAINAVTLLHKYGVKILASTDANNGSYAPMVAYGSSMHTEMELLKQCEMTAIEVLSSATKNIVETFKINDLGEIAIGKKATFLLISGRPDKNISDIRNIEHIWIDGVQIK